MKIHTAIKLSVSGVMALGLIVGCSEPEYPTPVPANGPSTLSAKVMLINASPDAPSLTSLINNAPVGVAMPFTGASGYAVAPVGPAQVAASATTGTIGGILGSANVIYRAGATNTTNFTFASGLNYTFFVTDTLNRPKPTTTGATNPGGPQFLQVADNLVAPAAGKANVRFFNLAVGTTSYFLTLSGNGTYFPAGRGYRSVSSGTAPNITTFANFVPVPTGTYDLQLRTTSVSGAIVATATGVVLGDGKIVTVIARGRIGKTGAQAPGLTVIPYN